MKLPTWATTVTPFSKNVALVLFVTLPLFTFMLGRMSVSPTPPVNTNYYSLVPTISPTSVPQLTPSIAPAMTSQPFSGLETLKSIKYTLPNGWRADVMVNETFPSLFFTREGGGHLTIVAYPSGTLGRREQYCQITGVCTEQVSFSILPIGNLSGYSANNIDATGNGPQFFAAKGSSFYIIYTLCPVGYQNTCTAERKAIMQSLVF